MNTQRNNECRNVNDELKTGASFFYSHCGIHHFAFAFVSLLVCALALTSAAFAQKRGSKAAPPQKNNGRPAASPTAAPEPFDGASVEKMAAQCVRLETEAGVIEIEMLAESAPETVRSFLNLAATGTLDTTTFSLVVKDFIIQGGNLSTRQTVTPAIGKRAMRTIPDEPSSIKHVRGIVSMARPDTPNGATTIFFILVGDGTHLDGKYAAFGRVVSGMEVADAINHAPMFGWRPEKPVRIMRATVAPCAVKNGEGK